MRQGGKNGILEDLRGDWGGLRRMEEESRICHNKYGLGEGQGGEDR